MGLLDKLVGDTDEALEDRQEWLVVVVRGQAVLEEDALPGCGLVKPIKGSATNTTLDLVHRGKELTSWACPRVGRRQ